MRTLLLTIHLCAVFGGCQLIRAPSNTALVVGQRLEFVCNPSVNFTVREWTKQMSSNSNGSKIFKDWSSPTIVGNRRFGYIKDHNSVTLYLNSTELADAGGYECWVQLGTEKQPDKYSAQLIVLETEPICEESIPVPSKDGLAEGSIVRMSCRVNFRGNMTPTMEWRQHAAYGKTDEQGLIVTEMAETIVTRNRKISSTLTLLINSTYNATFITCKTYFQWDNRRSQQFAAVNVPDYSHTWNSSVIIVSDTTIDNKDTTVYASMSDTSTSTNKESLAMFNSINLLAGVAVLFGIASSVVAIVLCLRLRRKNSAATVDLARTGGMESEYDLIPYACTGAYDTIGEVNEGEDVMATAFPPRLGPLPSPNHSGSTPVDPDPPGVYSRIDHKLQPPDDRVSYGEKLPLNACCSPSNYAQLSVDKGLNTKSISRPNSYLCLGASGPKDIAYDNDEISSDYLHCSEVLVQSNSSNYTQIVPEQSDGTPKLYANPYLVLSAETDEDIEHEEMTSACPKISLASLQFTNADYMEVNPAEQTNGAPTSHPNPYLALSADVDKDCAPAST